MDKDKQIQKVPKYSIDKISAKSDLATRGLRELGLLKDKKHFTIIYVCQFCGRLINYSSTPCIFCGNYPKIKREVIIAQALSSNSLEFDHLLAISKAIKEREDLELLIANFRALIDEVLENQEKFPFYKSLFHLMEDLLANRPLLNEKASEFLKKTRILCKECGHTISFANLPCLNCAARAERRGENPKNLQSKLTEVEKLIIAFNDFLTFTENYLDMGENKESLEELIFVSVYIVSRLIEKDEAPDKDLRRYWQELLRKAHYFGSYSIHGAIEIQGNKVSIIEEEGHHNSKASFKIMSLGTNLSYLLKS